MRDGLWDVVAPRTDAASGARSDWMVVLALVSGRSTAWRKAIRERDVLAAARMVPPTAEAGWTLTKPAA